MIAAVCPVISEGVGRGAREQEDPTRLANHDGVGGHTRYEAIVKNEAPNAFLQTRAQVSTASCLTRVVSNKASQEGASLAQKPEGLGKVSQAGVMAQEKAWE